MKKHYPSEIKYTVYGNLKNLFTLMLLTLAILALSSEGVEAQVSYNVTPFVNAGHPGGVNTETTDATTTGWTQLTVGPQSANFWSNQVTLPFSFNLFGNPVSTFRVSQNGLLTFDTDPGLATATPPNANTNLPDASLPANTICMMWDEFTAAPPTGSGDNVIYREFGTSPNRQFWVKYYSFEIGNPVSSFAYFACVFEESTDKFYVVDLYSSTSPLLTTTVGVQLNASTAVQFGDNTLPNGGNGSTPPDNDFWEFSPFSLTGTDAGVTSIDAPVSPVVPGPNNVQVTIANFGATTITSAIVNWSVNSVPQSPFAYTGSIAPFGSDGPITIGSFNFGSGIFTIDANTSAPNGGVDANTTNDAASATVIACAPLSGIYTINPVAGDFPSFSLAAEALTICGIGGPVTFNVAPGTYNERLILGEITGASATNTITFNGGGATLANAATVSDQRAVILLNGADHVTIDNLTINAEGGTFGWGVQFFNHADYNTISNCVINAQANSSSANFGGIAMSGSLTSPTSSGEFGDYNTIINNTITGNYAGITNYGSTTVPAVSNQILNNIIKDFYIYGIYNGSQDGLVISGNDISRSSRTGTSTTFHGVYLFGGQKNSLVEKNKIHNTNDLTSSTTVYGIYVNGPAASGFETRVENNLIYNVNNNTTIYGLWLNDSGIKAYHNTIVLDNASATTGTLRAIYQGSTAYSNVDIQNNIITIGQGGTGIKHGMYIANGNSTAVTADNNVVDITSTTGSNYAGFWGANRNTIADFNTASGFTGNVSADPMFVSPLTGDYTPSNSLINNIGAPVGVLTDITGALRDPLLPDPGAYSFDVVGTDAAIVWVGPVNPVGAGLQNVVVSIVNTQTATINQVSLQYTDGVFTSPVEVFLIPGGLAAGMSVNYTFATQFNITGVHTLTASILSVAPGVDAIAANNITDPVTVCPALSGPYTIDAGAAASISNFTSFTAAVTAMSNCGISGPVTFSVMVGSGPYNEQIFIPEITGASAVNTITFDGNGEMIYFASTNSAQRAVITLLGADYVTIEDLVVNSDGGTYGWGIHLTSKADYNTIQGCTVLSSTTSTSSNFSGIVISGSFTSPTTTGDAANNVTVMNNTITGGYYAITHIGTGTTNLAVNNIYSGNIITENYFYGFYISNQNAPVFLGNSVTNRSGSGYGLYLINTDHAFQVIGNKFDNWGTYGIYMSGCNNSAVSRPVVANNFVTTGSGTYGIYMPSAKEVNLWHNSVNMGGTGRCLFISSTTTSNTDIRNNSFAYTGTSSGYAMYVSSTASILACDHNNYYSNGSNFVYYGGAKADLATLQATNVPVGNDANSKSGDPEYLSTTDLHSAGIQLNNAGTPVAITTDIDGDTRSATTPDIGADEYTPPPFDIGVVALSEPTAGGCFPTSSNVSVEVISQGTDPVDFSLNNLTISVSITGPLTQSISNTVTTGILSPGNTLIIPVGTVALNLAGTHVISITSSMPGDGLAFNNNLVVNVVSSGLAPEITSSSATSVCGIGPVTYSATTNFGTINWYDAPSGGNLLFSGSNYTTTITSTTDVYVQAESGFIAGSLAALPLAGGNGCGGGNMFNVTPTASFDLTGFDMNLGATLGTSVTVNVYYKTGTYVGSQLVAGDWTFHEAVTVTAAGPNNASFVPINPLSLSGGTLYGIYLNADVDYSNISPPVFISNADLTLELGDGLCGLFSGNNVGRGFNGTVYYNAGCASNRVTVTAISTPAAQVDAGADQLICEGSSATISAVPGSGYTTFMWEPGTLSGPSITVFPTTTTTYVLTANDGTCTDTDTVEVTVSPTSVAGLASTPEDTICSGADATFMLDGYIGDIQWQQNVGAGWTDIPGATTTPYDVVTPATGTMFRAVVTSGVCPAVISNEITLYTITPAILTANGDTRCGPGVVNLTATGIGNVEWYENPAFGVPVATGGTFSPFITANKDYYVQASVVGGAGNGPELIHYKFDGAGTDVINDASTPVGNNPASITGTTLSQSGIGQFGSGLQGTGGTSSSNVINTGWLTNLGVESWTISLYLDNIPSSSTLFYYFGDAGATSFRCFTNGVAGPDNLMLRGPVTDVTIPGGATVGTSNVCHFVYDATTQVISGYRNGILMVTVAQPALNITGGTGFQVGGYASNTGLSGTMDEFRLYNRALSAAEIASTWNGALAASCESARQLVSAIVTPAPDLTITSSAIASCDGAPVTLTAGSSDPGANYNFTWSPGGQTTAAITVTPSMTTEYIVHGIDANTGCENYDTVTVEVVPVPVVNITTSNGTSFCDVANTQLNAGTSAQLNFINTDNIQVPATGLTSGNASPYPSTINVSGLSLAASVATVSLQNISHTFPGDIDVLLVSPSGDAVVLMSDVGGSNDLTGESYVFSDAAATVLGSGYNATGTYLPTNSGATDTYAAPGPGSVTQASPALSMFTGNLNGTWSLYIVDDAGGDVGSIAGGWSLEFVDAASISYSWTPGTGLSATTVADPVATPSTTTTYEVTVTNTLTGCSTTESITVIVEATPAPVITLAGGTNPLCLGDLATLDPGSFPGHSFQWSNFANTSTIGVTAPGNYSVIVTSPNGCIGTASPYTLKRNVLTATTSITSNYNGAQISCAGAEDGEITVSVNSLILLPPSVSAGPFEFSVNGGTPQSGNIITGLGEDTYAIEVTDLNTGCKFTTNTTTIEPPPVIASTVINNHVSCFGGSNGSATVNATGGTGAYAYNWLTPVPKQTQTNSEIPAGTWSVEVTDANGCVGTATVTITEPPLLTADLGPDRIITWGAMGQVGCTDINGTYAGGTPPYTYAWTTNDPNNPAIGTATTGSITNVCNMLDTSFTYTVTVTDAEGCTVSATITLLYANIDCSNNQNATKIKICRVPPGNPANCQTICISANAVPALLANGSYLGPCYANCGTPPRTVEGESLQSFNTELNVYPNPASGMVHIEYRSEWSSAGTIMITDLQGRVVDVVSVNRDYTFSTDIDLGNLEDGIYLINIMDGDALVGSAKVVKVK